MPMQITEEADGKILVIHISGKLVKADYAPLEPEFERRVRQQGKVRVLFDLTGFHGWEAGAAWEDMKFGVAHYADISRLAMVGENKWQHAMATICRPFTKAVVRYFDHADSAGARAWLTEA